MTDEGGGQSPQHAGKSPRSAWAVLVLLSALCLAVRLYALGADPPSWLSWSRGLYTDEGFYSLDARHHTLFGGWAPGNFHDRYVSPLLTAMQIAAFRIGGATRVSARCVSVFCSCLTLLLFWLALRWRCGLRAANAGLAFLGLVPAFALYNRMALQETPTALLLTLSLFCMAAADRYRRLAPVLWVCAGIAAFSVAGSKSLGLFAIPGLIAAALMLPALKYGANDKIVHPRGRTDFADCDAPAKAGSPSELAPYFSAGSTARSRSVAVVSGLALAAVVYGVFWGLPHHGELARMNRYYLAHQVMPHSPGTVLINIRRFAVDPGRGALPFLAAFAGVPLVLAAMSRRALTANASDVFAVGWLIVGLTALAVMNYAPSRYLVLLLPPLCYLAALRCDALNVRGQAIAMAAFALMSGYWYVRYASAMTFTEAAASRRLTMEFPKGALLLGDMAPQLCLGTPLRAAPFQAGLSNDDRPLETLHPAGVLVGREPAWRGWWMKNAPEILGSGNRVERVTIGGRGECVVDVYRVPLRESSAAIGAGARNRR